MSLREPFRNYLIHFNRLRRIEGLDPKLKRYYQGIAYMCIMGSKGSEREESKRISDISNRARSLEAMVMMSSNGAYRNLKEIKSDFITAYPEQQIYI